MEIYATRENAVARDSAHIANKENKLEYHKTA